MVITIPLGKQNNTYLYYEINRVSEYLIQVSDVKYCDTEYSVLQKKFNESDFKKDKVLPLNYVLYDISTVLMHDLFKKYPDTNRGTIYSAFKYIVDKYQYSSLELIDIIDVILSVYNSFTKGVNYGK